MLGVVDIKDWLPGWKLDCHFQPTICQSTIALKTVIFQSALYEQGQTERSFRKKLLRPWPASQVQPSGHLLRLDHVQTIKRAWEKTILGSQPWKSSCLTPAGSSRKRKAKADRLDGLTPQVQQGPPWGALTQVKNQRPAQQEDCNAAWTLGARCAANAKRGAAATGWIINMIRNTQSKHVLADWKAQ